MQTASAKIYSLKYNQAKTYIVAALFVCGNIVLPQLCHLVPQGGLRLLPIYFFTLIAAYKYGWRAGLLTAVLSPLVNSALFGMPPLALLPGILFKSVVLAAVAGFASARFKKASLALLCAVVLAYQLVGSLAEWAMVGSLAAAFQDFTIGIPGMFLQVFGGWLFINRIIK